MVIAYDSIFYILFLHYIVRESKNIFRGAAFYNSEAKRLLLMVLAVRPIGPWFLKSCLNKSLKITPMCALWTKPDVHIGFLFQGINTGP